MASVAFEVDYAGLVQRPRDELILKGKGQIEISGPLHMNGVENRVAAFQPEFSIRLNERHVRDVAARFLVQ